MNRLMCLLVMMLALTCSWARGDHAPTVLSAAGFGAVGDGVTDDGPALGRMMARASEIAGPVQLQFEPARVYLIRTSPQRYVFPFGAASDLTLDGRGSTFLLDSYLRFMDLTESRNVTVKHLQVDYSPLPFADGTVVEVDTAARCLLVRVEEGMRVHPGGPTKEDGEQAFFSMLWHDGPYGPVSRHYWTERIEATEEPGLFRVYATREFGAFSDIEPERWRISLPVPGVAHRFGPGPCFRISGNDTVTFEDVELWSAPWFGFEVTRNRGKITFRRVNIRPKPETRRLMSLWRDGFHVKGNSGSLLWEDCILGGMNDDALNISTHSSSVQRVIAPDEVEVRQKFPLLPIPWHVGSTLVAADEAARRLLGSARVTEAVPGPEPGPIQGMPAAPAWRIRLDAPIQGLQPGTMVWDPGQCNPDTTLRRCRIEMSCRLQSPVTLENCDVTALLWFYSEHVEGAFPSGVRVRDCSLRRGRGNPTLALVISGGPGSDAAEPEAGSPPRAIHDVLIEGNTIQGSVQIEGVQGLRLLANRFREPGAQVRLSGNHALEVRGNTDAAGRPYLEPPPQ
ncbi:MAG: hypothetical protein HPY44_09935 [Armatimonadetes bacterium]|nr:hypothetical protein [Armatimonadota bacterium]